MRKMNCLRLLPIAAFVAAITLVANNTPAAVGDIYESNDGTILRFAGGNGTPSTLVSNLPNPKGIAFDGNGHFYVADATRGAIYRFSSIDGSQSFGFASNLSSPVGLTFDVAGSLFEADAGSGTIFKFATADGTKSSFATGLSTPYGLAFDAAGNLIEADKDSGSTFRFSPSGERTTIFQR